MKPGSTRSWTAEVEQTLKKTVTLYKVGILC